MFLSFESKSTLFIESVLLCILFSVSATFVLKAAVVPKPVIIGISFSVFLVFT